MARSVLSSDRQLDEYSHKSDTHDSKSVTSFFVNSKQYIENPILTKSSISIRNMIKSIKLDVFGKIVLAVLKGDAWETFYLDSEGKRRIATNIQLPSFVKESEIESYLIDLCHEWASDKHPTVKRLD